MRELSALEDPKMREANERRSDDHGVNLSHLRSLAKRLKTQHELAFRLWATGDTAAPSGDPGVQAEGFLCGRARRDDPRQWLSQAPRLVHRECGEAQSARR